MGIPKRYAAIPGTYFVTSRTWQSRPLFSKRKACEIFMEALIGYRDEGVYALHAFVLMPEHFHILLTPATSLERAGYAYQGRFGKKDSRGDGIQVPNLAEGVQ
jgi:putative transposase